MNIKISIIVPVYNAEKYLSRCLDSILDNSYNNIEIIIINDGSTDNSQNIINKYKKKYPQYIIAEEQENKGPAETRNSALKIASGEYIMFIDSDDYIEKDYLENYVKYLKDDNYDVIFGGYLKTTDDKVLYEISLKDEYWSKYMIMGPYSKLYKKSLLLKNNISFLKVNIGEDIYFNLQVVAIAKKVKIIGYSGYNWYTNTLSISNTMHKDIKNLEIDKLLNESYNDLKNKNAITHENYQYLELYYYGFIIWVLQWTTSKIKFKEMSKEYEKLFKWLEERFPKYKKNGLIGLTTPRGERAIVRFMFCFFMIAHKLKVGKILVYIYSRIRK